MNSASPRSPRGVVLNLLARCLVGAVLLVPSLACVSSGVWEVSNHYYYEGPESALARLESEEVRPQDQQLLELERAIALQELGRYEESVETLRAVAQARAENPTSVADAVASMTVNDASAAYSLEYFEEVYLHTMAAVNALALQDLVGADKELNRALELMEAQPCAQCRYTFSRYLAAIVDEELGDEEEALATIVEASAEKPSLTWLAREVERVAGEPSGPDVQPASVDRRDEAGRVLYVVLLLGRGPMKVEEAVYLPPSHGVAWPAYIDRGPDVVVRARLLLSDRPPVDSVELTQMLELGRASLKARRAALIVKESTKTIVQEVVASSVEDEHGFELGWLLRSLFLLGDHADLRHWASLPATCQILRVELPSAMQSCSLEYLGAGGHPIDREVLELPSEWTDGPLFVTRRMP